MPERDIFFVNLRKNVAKSGKKSYNKKWKICADFEGPMSTDIYLIRHGEAEGNLYRRALGITESRLTAQGVRQAEAAKERFGTVKIDKA